MSSSPDPKKPEGDPKDKDSVAYRRRREQVRKAQRTHRERKETYIKSLENEVLARRTNEAKMAQEQQNLHAEIARLKRILDQNGLVYDASQGNLHTPNANYGSLGSNPVPPNPGLSTVQVGIMASSFHQQQLHIYSPQSGGGSQFWLSGTESEASLSGSGKEKAKTKHSFFRSRSRGTSDAGDRDGHANRPEHAIVPPAKHLRDLDPTALGMEFVLTLEAPCLHHTQHGPSAPEPNAPTGHALTTTAPLLFQSPTQPVNTTTTKFPPWETASLDLEKLLSLSYNFDFDHDEVTPVQAWSQIRNHPRFGEVEIKSLRGVVEELGKGIKCHGFGAVIETDLLSAVLRDIFPSVGREFSFGFD